MSPLFSLLSAGRTASSFLHSPPLVSNLQLFSPPPVVLTASGILTAFNCPHNSELYSQPPSRLIPSCSPHKSLVSLTASSGTHGLQLSLTALKWTGHLELALQPPAVLTSLQSADVIKASGCLPLLTTVLITTSYPSWPHNLHIALQSQTTLAALVASQPSADLAIPLA
jgi:hypothetical protein